PAITASAPDLAAEPSPPAPPPATAPPAIPAAPATPPTPGPATQAEAPAPAAPAAPAHATASTIAVEIASSGYAQLQTLLKTNFPDEYDKLIEFAVRRRNEGVGDQQFGQEMFERIQDMLRAKLKLGIGASTETMDKLAANERELFHALGTDSASFCL